MGKDSTDWGAEITGITSLTTGAYGAYGEGHGIDGHGDDGPHFGIPVYRVPAFSVPPYPMPSYSVPPPTGMSSRRYFREDRFPRTSQYGHYSRVPLASPRFLSPWDAQDSEAYQDSDQQNVPIDQNQLLQSAQWLHQALSSRPDDAEVWLDYLKPALILEIVSSDGDPASMVKLLKNYDGLSGNAQLSDIWTEPGFRRTHQGLRSWVDRHALPSGDSEIPSPEPPTQPIADPATDHDANTDSQPTPI